MIRLTQEAILLYKFNLAITVGKCRRVIIATDLQSLKYKKQISCVLIIMFTTRSLTFVFMYYFYYLSPDNICIREMLVFTMWCEWIYKDLGQLLRNRHLDDIHTDQFSDIMSKCCTWKPNDAIYYVFPKLLTYYTLGKNISRSFKNQVTQLATGTYYTSIIPIHHNGVVVN
jgi:hypothetical protein